MTNKLKKNLFLELGASLASDHPVRNIITANSLEVIEKHRQKYNNIDVFTTVFQYDNADIRNANQLGSLYFDLDGQTAHEDIKKLTALLINYGCPTQSIYPFFSGNKGFHVEVPFEPLGIEPDKILNKIFGNIAKKIKDENKLLSLDTAIYDNVRLWRLPNSINSKSGLYKIPLSLNEINLPLDEIKKLAKSPRTNFSYPDVLPWESFNELFKKAKNQKRTLNVKVTDGVFTPVGEGERNITTFKRAIRLKAEGKSLQEAITICKGIADTPPLPENEIIKTVSSAYQDKYTVDPPEAEESKEPLIIQLLEELTNSEIVFFHDEYKDGYAAITGDGKEILRLKSKAFKQWLSHFTWTTFGKIASSDIIASVVQTLEGRAVFDGELYPLSIRLAEFDGSIWYDLGEQRAIQITPEHWTLSESPPILFRRLYHQQQQVISVAGGNIANLCKFVNLRSEEEKLLFQVYTIASFIPGFPHPLLVLHGAQGSGKTTPLRMLKILIDPSVLKTLSTPDSNKEFVQLASHHLLLTIDNLSAIPDWLSDALARAVTGDGFSKRELYSDDDDVIYSFQRVIALNGINLVVQKADLLDRSILLGLERIPKNKRKEEKELWREFEEQRPLLLGAIFDAVVKALRIYPTIHLTNLPRMADFTHWGCAIAKAIGYTEEDFITAYNNNINRQNEEAIAASPVGIALMAFMEDKISWEGTPTELLLILDSKAESLKINLRGKNWPKDAARLTKAIELVSSNLAEENITISRPAKARPRRIILTKTQQNTDSTDKPTENENSKADNSVATMSVEQQTIPLTDETSDENTKATNQHSTVPTGSSEKKHKLKRCYCGSTKFWQTKFHNIVCATCHPPISESEVVEWLYANEAQK